jgi:hypothetical protein
MKRGVFSMDDKILELYEMLGIQESNWPSAEQTYDNHTPFKKCGATVNVPVALNNTTMFLINRYKE